MDFASIYDITQHGVIMFTVDVPSGVLIKLASDNEVLAAASLKNTPDD